ncbi:hypothetical protein PHYSODRAFT_327746 [Phytophthora sojae]|uniref:Uncharacterized protein n=1 Tax=Phytophthora sojae (strain P6497) TaxID=1094619 RepID=G4Z5R6_PHYSP|nr:hypothetical protein PHYSODRAFT_327746 [Phytophthora sojae]EGZ19499.1 hypothetical protein PHYSODRAFT_327746 [Phytophthora sojae]|eukprot:XP_009522216.1 hypothetical protein PHYSODRAFT_327746 [Phytophthora sojae]
MRATSALAKPTRASVQFRFQFQSSFQFQCRHASPVCTPSSLVRPALPLRTPSSSHPFFGVLHLYLSPFNFSGCAAVGANMDEAAMQHADSVQQMFASLAAMMREQQQFMAQTAELQRQMAATLQQQQQQQSASQQQQ